MTYRAIRGYKYILQLEDCIVLHWGMGNRFRSLRPTFPEDKLKREKKAISYHIRLPVCSFDVRYHSIIWPKKEALLRRRRPCFRRPFLWLIFLLGLFYAGRSIWYLLVIGFRAKFDLCTPQRAFLNSFELLMIFAATLTITLYVRLGDVDFKQTESISLIGRWNIYKRRSILIGWKYILNTEIPSSSTMSLHS